MMNILCPNNQVSLAPGDTSDHACVRTLKLYLRFWEAAKLTLCACNTSLICLDSAWNDGSSPVPK